MFKDIIIYIIKMPKNNIDYSKTIIYKIVCKDINIKDCYVGSTTDFVRRKSEHKKKSKKSNIYIYEFIRENGNWENWEMIEIEKYNAVDKLDALKKERYFLEELKATLNKKIPSRTKKEYDKEWKEAYPEYKKEYDKEYYEVNKEKLNQNKKEKITCECGSIISKGEIAKHKRTKKHEDLLNK